MDYDTIKSREIVLKNVSDSMLDGRNQMVRMKSLKRFIPMFSRTLKLKESFTYSFDSLKFLKRFTAADGSFRLYNWLLKFDDGTFHYFGVIQLNKGDSMRLIPLRDIKSQIDTNWESMVGGPDEWFGVLYYDMFSQKIKGKTYNILLGWDGNDRYSDKKVIEVLSFDKKRKPQFGAPIFKYTSEVIKTRVIFSFSGDANVTLNHIPEYNLITFDHLVPPNEKSKNRTFLYVPDGTYDYFEYSKGMYYFKDDLFHNFKKTIPEAGKGGNGQMNEVK